MMTRTMMRRTHLGAEFTLEIDLPEKIIYFAVNGRRTGKTFSSVAEAFEWVREEFEES